LQCFERSLRHLPITLIEITTMAHCMYALIIHVLWWGKPFSVEEPTTQKIQGEKMRAILSYIWMSSAVSCPLPLYLKDDCPEFESIHFSPDMVDKQILRQVVPVYPDSSDTTHTGECIRSNDTCGSHTECAVSKVVTAGSSTSRTEQDSFKPVSDPEEPDIHVSTLSQRLKSYEPTIREFGGTSSSTSQDQTTKNVRLVPGQYLSNTGFCLRPESVHFKWFDDYYNETPLKKRIYLHKHDINRWSLASLAITQYGLPAPSIEDSNYIRLETSPISGKAFSSEHRNQMLWKIALINGLESVVYILAWNYVLSNDKASSLLRGSILFSFTPLVVIGILCLLRTLCGRSLSFSSESALVGPFIFFFLVSGVLYVTSKLSLIMLAVNDLFYLPEEAYQVATWANNFPHIF